MTHALPQDRRGHACQVFLADDLYVSIGVNTGEALGLVEEVALGDSYALEADARAYRLVLLQEGGATRLGQGSDIGGPGDPVSIVARHVMMSPQGERVELMLMDLGSRRVVLPLTPLSLESDYTLIQAEPPGAEARIADLMCLAFARGTRITLASGLQVPIEALMPGTMVLTRDHGPQPVRLISHASLRAHGAFAPVVITAGTFGNSGDLIVSQHHRIFLYQRERLPGLATSELLVQARHLVDDERVWLRMGGVTDWYSLVFDHHEIIYAEGIPAESLMVNDATVSRLPPEIATELRARFPSLAHVQHFGSEAGRSFLDALAPGALHHPGPRAVPAASRRPSRR